MGYITLRTLRVMIGTVYPQLAHHVGRVTEDTARGQLVGQGGWLVLESISAGEEGRCVLGMYFIWV
jgi:hypothetical protein